MISVTELRNGTKVEMDGGLWECLDYQHQKIGRGGAKVVGKFRSLETGSIVERTFNATEKLQDIFIDYRQMQFLFADDDHYTFMDMETFEQPVLNRADRRHRPLSQAEPGGDGGLLPGQAPQGHAAERGRAGDHPDRPGVRGDTVSGGSKPALLESGATVNVPLFIEQGETIRVDTRSGEYLGRA